MFAAANGVVIATEKKLPSILVDETSVSLTSLLKLNSSFSELRHAIRCLFLRSTNTQLYANSGAKDSVIDSEHWSCLQVTFYIGFIVVIHFYFVYIMVVMYMLL